MTRMSAFFDLIAGLAIEVGSLLGRTKPKDAALTLHNTQTGEDEPFSSLKPGLVRMYNCGPTVYGPQHIGNLSMFVFVDVLRRTLESRGYEVKQVINFTDVGHLVSDADDGEDKMTKGLKREKLALTLANMKKLGVKYATAFLDDIRALNVKTAGTAFPYASEYIAAQIAMVQTLEEKGYAYRGNDGVYFDTTRFEDYGKLGDIDLTGLREGARVEARPDKRSPTDFLLWKLAIDGKTVAKKSELLGWDSPWGRGFPGWHIECSAMARAILGDQIDIHTGGIEHIPVHHNNEIAQSEAATGKRPFSRFWLHRAHLQIDGAKIAKSSGKTVYLKDIVKKGYHPLAFRYLLLGSHYRSTASFSWEALTAAQQAFLRIRRFIDSVPAGGRILPGHMSAFDRHIDADLNTAGALSVVWETMKDRDASPADIRATILQFDTILGLGLTHEDARAQELYRKESGELVKDVPEDIQALLTQRDRARAEKRFEDADKLRASIEKKGYAVVDSKDGARVVSHA
jgi:cysteinyl-tRNA synthetase